MSSLLNSERLSIEAVNGLSEQISKQINDILDRLYQLFKEGYVLSKSSHFKGGAAEAFKCYMEHGPIQVITELMDVCSATEMFAQMILMTFNEYESCGTGVVDANRIVETECGLGEHKNRFESYIGHLQSVLGEAAAFISVEQPNFVRITEDYLSSKEALDEIKHQLEEADKEACIFADELYAQIERTKNLLDNVMNACYVRNAPNYENMAGLTNFDWYRKGDNLVLQSLLQAKPFAYLQGDVCISEDQWLVGVTDDIYAYAGYGFLNADGSLKLDDGTLFASGAASILDVNGYAQFTRFLRLEADAQVGYAEGSAEIGRNGYHIKGGAGFVKGHAEIVFGDENANLTVSGNADVLSASGEAACEFDMESGTFKIGAKGEASAAEVEVEVRREFGGLGASVSASAGVSVGGGFYMESQVIAESEYVNINSCEVNLGAALGLGLDIKVDALYPYFKPGKLFGF